MLTILNTKTCDRLDPELKDGVLTTKIWTDIGVCIIDNVGKLTKRQGFCVIRQLKRMTRVSFKGSREGVR